VLDRHVRIFYEFMFYIYIGGSSSYIVQVLLKVILQGSKVDQLMSLPKKNFDAAVAEAATAVFVATIIFEKMVSEI
jgi:hypothetical protein